MITEDPWLINVTSKKMLFYFFLEGWPWGQNPTTWCVFTYVSTYELGVEPLLQAMEIYRGTDLVKHRTIEEF